MPVKTTTAAALVQDLLRLTPPPTAAGLREHLAPFTTEVMVPGPNLDHPAWARSYATDSIFLTFTGDVRGMTVDDDPRGWGTHVDIIVASATLADIEEVIGETHPVARNPDDFHSGDTVVARPAIGDRQISVFVEHRDGAVISISMNLGKL